MIQPVATNPGQVVKINDASLRINEHMGETGLHSFGCIHPDYESWSEELRRLKDAGICGIKLHPVYQGCYVDDADVEAFDRDFPPKVKLKLPGQIF